MSKQKLQDPEYQPTGKNLEYAFQAAQKRIVQLEEMLGFKDEIVSVLSKDRKATTVNTYVLTVYLLYGERYRKLLETLMQDARQAEDAAGLMKTIERYVHDARNIDWHIGGYRYLLEQLVEEETAEVKGEKADE